ncbi:bacteriorhodopsin [Lacisediminihabitans sp. FW035]
MTDAIEGPWTATLTSSEYLLVLYFIVVAGLALLAGLVRTWTTRGEVGSRYRSATVARLTVTAVATLSYVAILLAFRSGYHPTGSGFEPDSTAILVSALRYMDWSITVPLLTVELISVCVLSGAAARKTVFLAMTGAFLMIFTGFLGTFVFGGTSKPGVMLLWGALSAVFWIATTAILLRAVRRSLPRLTPESAVLLRNATILLLSGWVVYPVVYLIQVFTGGGGWATAIQVTLCVADVAIKIGFGGLVHRVAKLRTAEDVRAGRDVHPESIWISSVKQSDAGVAQAVYLATDAEGHTRRPRPPSSTAVAAVPDSRPDFGDEDG